MTATSEIIASCLSRIEAGEATIETCVRQYPQIADLEALLRVAIALRPLQNQTMSDVRKAALERRLVQVLSQTIQTPDTRRVAWWAGLRRVGGLAALIAVLLLAAGALARLGQTSTFASTPSLAPSLTSLPVTATMTATYTVVNTATATLANTGVPTTTLAPIDPIVVDTVSSPSMTTSADNAVASATTTAISTEVPSATSTRRGLITATPRHTLTPSNTWTPSVTASLTVTPTVTPSPTITYTPSATLVIATAVGSGPTALPSAVIPPTAVPPTVAVDNTEPPPLALPVCPSATPTATPETPSGGEAMPTISTEQGLTMTATASPIPCVTETADPIKSLAPTSTLTSTSEVATDVPTLTATSSATSSP